MCFLSAFRCLQFHVDGEEIVEVIVGLDSYRRDAILFECKGDQVSYGGFSSVLGPYEFY